MLVACFYLFVAKFNQSSGILIFCRVSNWYGEKTPPEKNTREREGSHYRVLPGSLKPLIEEDGTVMKCQLTGCRATFYDMGLCRLLSWNQPDEERERELAIFSIWHRVDEQ